MSLHTTHETVLRRKQTHLAPFQTDSYMSERDLRSRSDLIKPSAFYQTAEVTDAFPMCIPIQFGAGFQKFG